MKVYLMIIAITIFVSSCLKQSIPDAMLGRSGKHGKVTATLSYEINGNLVSISVADADNQGSYNPQLQCVKSNGYTLSAISTSGEFVFTFLTDSLITAAYSYPDNWGATYVTDFQGSPQYVYSPNDNLNFIVTQYNDGHMSGIFSGQVTPMINNSYGAPGSVLITNGRFNNVPIVY